MPPSCDSPGPGGEGYVLEAHPSARVHLLANPLLFREPLSPVCHGRDRFGNLTTNLLEADLAALAGRGLEGLEVTLEEASLPLVRVYSDVEVGEPCALIGSSGRLEIAVARGRADARPGAHAGARVRVRRRG